MSTPLELPLPAASLEPATVEADAAVQRANLRVVPTPGAPSAPVDFDDFVRRHTPRLRRQLMRKLGDISESEEIAQETLLRAHQHLHTLATEDELIAWTTVVGQRLAIDRLRVRGRSVAVAEVPEDSRVGRDTADIVVARAEARTALESLEAIPERQAAILWAREVEGLHYDAIADRFGISEPAVRSLLHRGRRALRQEYAARGGTLPLRGLVPLAPGLIALRSLGRLRDTARATVKTNATAFATLSIAGAIALGMTLGTPGSPFRPAIPETNLGSGQITEQTFGQTVAGPGDVRAADVASSPAATSDGSARPAVALVLDSAPGACTGEVPGAERNPCIAQRRARGDVLYIGPDLPENPVVRRVGIGQDIVAVCRYAPSTPVTRCSSGATAPDRPVQSAQPSNLSDGSPRLEGATP